MAVISAANLNWYLSGGAENADPAASLGGVISSTEVDPATIFDAVSGAEALAGDVEYRCVFFKNIDANAGGLQSAVIWIETQTAGADSVKIALDAAGETATADTVATESAAPDPALTFAACANKGAGLSLGTLHENDYYGVWIERTVPAECAAANDNSFVLKVEGDSGA